MSVLRLKAIRGVSWSMLDAIAGSGITFLIGLFLARILSPEEFGILGMVAVFIALSNTIIDSGLSNALIRKVNANDIDYNTGFWTNIVLGIFLYFILFISAPFISNFFNELILVPILRTIGVILIFNSFSIIQRTLLTKNIDFKTQTKISLVSSFAGGIIGVLMAIYSFGVWSLVAQQIIRQFLNCLFLWIFSDWRPKYQFSFDSFNELFGFGSKLMLSALIETIYQNVYYIVIGRFYTSSELGQYTRAQQFNNIFSNTLTLVVNRVSYPLLSSIQNDSDRLKKTYRRIIQSTMLVSFGSLLSLVAMSKSLIIVLIGAKWLLAVSFLQIICFRGMLYPLHAINLNILQVKGRSDLFLRLEIIKKVIATGPIIIGVFYGIKFMLWGAVFTSVVALFINTYYSNKLLNYSIWMQIWDILPSLLVSSFVSIILWGISFLGFSNLATLIIQFFVGILLFYSIYSYLRLAIFIDLKKIVISTYKNNYA
jgi:teichuronic acid exporter|tara:strand:+ start:848 stop:2296 length:1449 start_codon:yes stop_codon:yes gene_type:complete